MAKLIILTTHHLEQVDDVIIAWNKVGVKGATLLDGYGVRSYQEWAANAEFLPGMRSTLTLIKDNREHAILLFSVVYDDSQIPALLEATEGVLGDLTESDTGFVFVLDIDLVIRKRLKPEE